MVDPNKFFKHGRVPYKKCDLSSPCTHCGFRFLEYMDRQMKKLMEMTAKDPEWGELLRSGRNSAIKQRLDELVPLPKDR